MSETKMDQFLFVKSTSPNRPVEMMIARTFNYPSSPLTSSSQTRVLNLPICHEAPKTIRNKIPQPLIFLF